MNKTIEALLSPPKAFNIHEAVDSGKDQHLFGRIEVWLDGYKQEKCFAYDCERGIVERYAVKDFGDLVVRDGDFVIETVTGDVKVRWAKG